MNVTFHAFSIAISHFKENVPPSLNAQDKKILIIASIAFGFLIALYVAYRCYFSARSVKESDEITFPPDNEAQGLIEKDDFKNERSQDFTYIPKFKDYEPFGCFDKDFVFIDYYLYEGQLCLFVALTNQIGDLKRELRIEDLPQNWSIHCGINYYNPQTNGLCLFCDENGDDDIDAFYFLKEFPKDTDSISLRHFERIPCCEEDILWIQNQLWMMSKSRDTFTIYDWNRGTKVSVPVPSGLQEIPSSTTPRRLILAQNILIELQDSKKQGNGNNSYELIAYQLDAKVLHDSTSPDLTQKIWHQIWRKSILETDEKCILGLRGFFINPDLQFKLVTQERKGTREIEDTIYSALTGIQV